MIAAKLFAVVARRMRNASASALRLIIAVSMLVLGLTLSEVYKALHNSAPLCINRAGKQMMPTALSISVR